MSITFPIRSDAVPCRWTRGTTAKVALLVSASALALLSGMAAEAQDCGSPITYGDATCTLPAGSTTGVSIVQSDFEAGNTMTLQNDATLSPNSDAPNYNDRSNALLLRLYGQNGSSSVPTAQPGPRITVTNNGAVTAVGTSTQDSSVTAVAPLEFLSAGGSGAEPDDNGTNGGSGGNGGSLNVTNNSLVQIDASATQDTSAALQGISARSLGGDGGDQNSGIDGDQLGGRAGNGGAITVTNSTGATVTLGTDGAPVRGANTGRAISAISIGGTGGQDNGSGGNGGAVAIHNNGTVGVFYTEIETGANGVAGLIGLSVGGDGTKSFDNDDDGGDGASGGTVNLTNDGDISIDTTTTDFAFEGESAAILAEARGGLGGASSNRAAGGLGGGAGNVTVTNSGSIVTRGVGLSGVIARSIGGAGGAGNGDSNSTGGNGGVGGQINVDLSGTISTTGREAYGIIGQSIGGLGGGNAGIGGQGANGGDVSVSATSGSVTTTGDFAAGIALHSVGGGGGTGENFTNVLAGSGGDGGNGGNAGQAQITSAADVTTSGDYATGLLVQSIGGSGGTGGIGAGLVLGLGGDGGGGGLANIAIASNTGAITTQGYGSGGIIVQSISGGGGVAGADGGILSVGGEAGGGTNADSAYATNNGVIRTSGDASVGITVQSIGGGGGSASGSAGIFAVGGTGTAGGNGNYAQAYHVGGLVLTEGEFSHGILVQSIGGGGGSGGNVLDLSVGTIGIGGIGGNSAAGGNGGAACVTNTYDPAGCNPQPSDDGTAAPALSSSTVVTTGDFAVGVISQSIGGGGGTGGSAIGVDVAGAANVQIGASGSGGGNGGSALMGFDGLTLRTSGNNAIGLLTQSIGGGGGNGGNALALTAVSLVPIQVGGSSGAGGSGNQANTRLTESSISTEGANASAIVNQSIGGGGGAAGSAAGYDASVGIAMETAVGGTGGTGGSASQSQVFLTATTVSSGFNRGPTGPVADNSATDSHAIVVQSIGGGGGLGGSATADAITLAAPTGEDVSFAVTVSTAVGGSGGVGGNGGAVFAGLQEGSGAFTGGDGSIAILAQSIGGGGGDGGGVSSLADTIGDSDTISVNVSTAIGGNGGTGGNSDQSFVAIDEFSDVRTVGDHANAIVLQTISGGGGNGGVGSTTSNSVGNGFDVSVDIGLGGTGGSSGTNDHAELDLAQGSEIETRGANSHAVVLQAITGGGGMSQGGNLGLSASGDTGGEDEGEDVSASVNVAVGGSGGDSTTAGFVQITSNGEISTRGNDSDGIVAQAIGGSGGIGGSAANDVDSDGGFLGGDEGTSYALTASVGGTGGTGGNGGRVTLNHMGSVTTQGDWSDGILLQSIGGGGGTAGTATAVGSDATAEVALAIGGTGGTSGNGGQITASFDGSDASVATAGHGAHAVLAQSIGGGGGHGADGSTSANADITVGGGLGGSGGASGNGGAVAVTGDWLRASTQGEDAYAIAAQSIGGGGGTGGAGSTETSDDDDSHSISASVGGAAGGGGNGGAVSIDLGTTITTMDDRAFAILAQSIGGGGGVSGAADGATLDSLNLNGTSGATGNGGTVTVTLADGSTIATAGRGAHAILAQSIGGGGGILGDAGGGALGNTGIAFSGGFGTGADVDVTVNGDITTTGDYAFGILAQSIGGGGGLAGDARGIRAGSSVTQANGDMNRASGNITVTQSGTTTASGEGSVGIYAQSLGAADAGIIDIEANGTVTGGSGSNGAAILTSGGSSVEGTNAVVVGTEALVVAGTGADAIRHHAPDATRLTTLAVENRGVIDGSVRLHAADHTVTGSIHNTSSGTLTSASIYAGNVTNEGTLRIGDAGQFAQTRITGDYSQMETGTLTAAADFLGGRAAILSVDGDAELDGLLSVNASTLAPNATLTVLQTTGTLTGSLEVGDTRAVDYGIRVEDGAILIEAQDTHFATAFQDVSTNQSNAGAHLDAIFDAGGLSYATFLADLDRLAESDTTGRSYAQVLAALSPGSSHAPAAAQAELTLGRLDEMLSCATYSIEEFTLKEHPCIWSRAGVTKVDQGGNPGYTGTVYSIAGGGQIEVHPDWFLGFAIGHQAGNYGNSDGLSETEGDTGYLATTLKHQMGRLTLSGAVSASFGTFDTKRTINVPGFAGKANGNMDVNTLGGRVRAAYTFGNETAYVRPFADLNVVYAHASGYSERGGGAYNLRVDDASQTAFVAHPGLEVGARLNLSDGWLGRGFARGGVSFSSKDDWTTSASLADAPSSAGSFDTVLPVADKVARISAGIQISHAGGIDVTVEYGGVFGDNYSSHSGSLKFTHRF